jgi:spermidine synthase
MTISHYVGQELDIFAHAKNWKRYWSSKIRPFIRGDVLEVGAGLGSNTSFLLNMAMVRSWTCLEPDPKLASRLKGTLDANPQTAACEVIVGTTESFTPTPQFDCIIYIDVLEHIKADKQELESVACLLRHEGALIVLSPAHEWLYTPFDKAIGHFRRYTRKTLKDRTPSGCTIAAIVYLDSCGMLASIANRVLLRQADPSLKQILFWDRYLVPFSVRLDPIWRFRLGKSTLGIWRKQAMESS